MTVRLFVAAGSIGIDSPAAVVATANWMLSTAPPVDVTTTPPRTSMVPLALCNPANTVSLPRSELKIPAVSTTKANTVATTTKAIRMMAVSRPVMPCSSRAARARSSLNFLICLSLLWGYPLREIIGRAEGGREYPSWRAARSPLPCSSSGLTPWKRADPSAVPARSRRKLCTLVQLHDGGQFRRQLAGNVHHRAYG